MPLKWLLAVNVVQEIIKMHFKWLWAIDVVQEMVQMLYKWLWAINAEEEMDAALVMGLDLRSKTSELVARKQISRDIIDDGIRPDSREDEGVN